jgi:methyl-accepting chemotaxis protein
MNIQGKLLLGAGALALISIGLTSAFIGQGAYTTARDALTTEVQSKLTALREDKRVQIEDYMTGLTRGVQAMARSTTVIEAVKGFRGAVTQMVAETGGESQADRYRTGLGAYYTKDFVAEYTKRNAGATPNMQQYVSGLDTVSLAMQHHYIVANANPLGKKEQLMASPDASAYSKIHGQYHPSLEAAQKKFGYYDIFLVDIDTKRVVYTVSKELDFSTKLDTGIATKTGLADVVAKASAAKNKDDIFVSDFAQYLASYNDEAAFIAVPVFDGDRVIGVMAIQAPLDQISDVMTSRKRWKEIGLGSTGETYLVGPDKLMRTDSRFVLEDKAKFIESAKTVLSTEQQQSAAKRGTSVGLVKIDTDGVRDALAGTSGIKQYKDYRGEEVVGAFVPFRVLGLNWALLAEQDADEVYAPIIALRNQVLGLAFGLSLLLLALAGAATYFFVKNFMKPVNKLQETVRAVAGGDYLARSAIKTGDEMETLGSTLDNLLDDRIAALAKAEKENEQLNNSVIELLQSVAQISQRDLTVKAPVTEDIIGTVADSVNQLTSETSNVLRDVTKIAALVEHASGRVKSQADQVNQTAIQERESVGRMVTNIQHATAAMQAVAGLAEDSNKVASAAMQTTQTAQATVDSTVKGMGAIRETISEVEKRIKRLGERSQEISQIVGLINTISERTHVLSLNASMQAAIAGEAGRGFAVVAEEVQRLAENSRNATQQIANLVQNIQIETNETINTVNKTIDQVVQGSDMAMKSGQQMKETQETTSRLVGMVQQIAASVSDQVKMAEQLQTGATEIGKSTEQTADQLAQQGQITNSLVNAAQKLVESVSVFKLPQAA